MYIAFVKQQCRIVADLLDRSSGTIELVSRNFKFSGAVAVC